MIIKYLLHYKIIVIDIYNILIMKKKVNKVIIFNILFLNI